MKVNCLVISHKQPFPNIIIIRGYFLINIHERLWRISIHAMYRCIMYYSSAVFVHSLLPKYRILGKSTSYTHPRRTYHNTPWSLIHCSHGVCVCVMGILTTRECYCHYIEAELYCSNNNPLPVNSHKRFNSHLWRSNWVHHRYQSHIKCTIPCLPPPNDFEINMGNIIHL